MDGGFDLRDDTTMDCMGRTDLHVAAARGDPVLLKRLLENTENANVDVVDCYAGETPLFKAAEVGNVECVSLLLGKGASACAQCNTGSTPLHFAARSGSRAVVEKLLEAKAQVNAVNDFGKNALCWAVYRDNVACADRLLDAGATISKLVEFPHWLKMLLRRRRRCKNTAATLYGVLRKRWRVPRDVAWLLSRETWKTHMYAGWDE